MQLIDLIINFIPISISQIMSTEITETGNDVKRPYRKGVKKGTMLQVWEGEADETPGGLKKEHLKLNMHGRVVSIKRSEAAAKNMNLRRNKLNK